MRTLVRVAAVSNWTRLPVAFLVAASAALSAAGQGPLRQDSEQLKQKIAAINAHGVRQSRRAMTTTVTEQEVNAYLALEAAAGLPSGVVDPRISILGGNRVTGRAVVDLDRVRQQRNPTSLLDPARYLRGRLMVKATGLVRASGGRAQFDLESADIAGVPIPKFLLQEIVAYYSRSPEWPSGIDLDEPIALPAGIRELQVLTGRAVVIQ
jgi:hypothetical protein